MGVLGAKGDEQKQQSSADEMKQGGQDAINVGKEVAKTAKTVKQGAKIATKAAAGDIGGAVAEAAKDPESTGRALLMVLLIPIICIILVAALIIMCVSAIPIAVYNMVADYFSRVGEEWDRITYQEDDMPWWEKAWNYIIAIPVGELFMPAINYFFNPAKNADYQNNMFGSEDAFKMTTLDQMLLVEKKLVTRAEQLEETCKDAQSSVDQYFENYLNFEEGDGRAFHASLVTYKYMPPLDEIGAGDDDLQTERNDAADDLRDSVREYLYATGGDDKDEIKAKRDAMTAEFNKYVFDADDPELSKNTGLFIPSSDSYAMQVLALLSVQEGNSYYGNDQNSLAKQIGYDGSGSNSVRIGKIVDGSIDTWDGLFMPQYLMEESMMLQYLQYHYSALRNNTAADICEDAVDEYDTDVGVPLVDLLLYLDVPDLRVASGHAKIITDTNSEFAPRQTTIGKICHNYYYHTNPGGEDGRLVLHTWFNTTVKDPTIHYRYEYDVYIGARSVTEIAEKVGLWDGDFKGKNQIGYTFVGQSTNVSQMGTEIPPEATSFKAYMDYTTLTSRSSKQYKLQQNAWTDADGLRRYGTMEDSNSYYMVALGTYYSRECGNVFDITFEGGTTIRCIVGDIKADVHTDPTHRHRNGNVVEFIVETNKLSGMARVMGDVSYVNGIDLTGKPTSIVPVGKVDIY